MGGGQKLLEMRNTLEPGSILSNVEPSLPVLEVEVLGACLLPDWKYQFHPSEFQM